MLIGINIGLTTGSEGSREQCRAAPAWVYRVFRGTHAMPYTIRARDGAGLITLTRQTLEAAEKKAAELKEMGCFDIEITENVDREAA